MATTHASNFGSFGRDLPTDREGFVRYSPSRVDKARRALKRGDEYAEVARRYGPGNTAVAHAEAGIAAWRDE